MTNPQQQLDPYAEFGGKVGTPTSSPAPDPYAEFGGQQVAAPAANTPAPDESAANKPKGVWGTLTGYYDMGIKPVRQLIGQTYDDLDQEVSGVLGSLTPEQKMAAAQQEAASEQHKHQVYHSASMKFHKAMGDGTKPADVGGILGAGWELRKLFERGEGENPNDPILTMTDSALRGAEQEYQKTGEHAIATVNAIRHAANLHASGDTEGAMNALKDAIGEGSQTFGHGLATALPMIGPAAAKAGEDIPVNGWYGLGEAGALLTPAAIKAAKAGIVGKAADAVAKSPVGDMMKDVGAPIEPADAVVPAQTAIETAKTVARPIESLYSRIKGKATDAAYNVAEKGLDVASDAGDAVGRMTSTISDAFTKAVDAVKSNASPQEVAGSLQNLRKTMRGAAKEAGYTPEQILELDDQVQEAYAKAHTVSGGNFADDATAKATSYFDKFAEAIDKLAIKSDPVHAKLRDVFSRDQVADMLPEEKAARIKAIQERGNPRLTPEEISAVHEQSEARWGDEASKVTKLQRVGAVVGALGDKIIDKFNAGKPFESAAVGGIAGLQVGSMFGQPLAGATTGVASGLSTAVYYAIGKAAAGLTEGDVINELVSKGVSREAAGILYKDSTKTYAAYLSKEAKTAASGAVDNLRDRYQAWKMPSVSGASTDEVPNNIVSRAKAAGMSVVDYAQRVNKLGSDIIADAKAKDLARTTVGGAGIGAGLGGMTSGPAGAAMGASTGATLGSLSILADAAHSVFKGDVIKTLVDRGILPEVADKMVSAVYDKINANDTIKDIVQRVSAMKEKVGGMNPRETAIARAAEIDPELAKVATPAQMGYSSRFAESLLRKQPAGIGEYISKKFDKPAETASLASADRAVRAINPETADMNAEQLGAAVKANLPAPDVPTIDMNSPDYYTQATKGLLSAEDYAFGAGLIAHTPDQLVFNTLDSIGPRRFGEVMSKMSQENAAAIRQGLVKHLLDKARDPDTGVTNFKAFKKSLTEPGQAEKLGPEIHSKMKTLANGWAEMQDWRNKTNTKAVTLATQIGGGLLLGLVDVLVAGADPVKIAALSVAEYAGYKFAGPFIAQYFMKPRNVQSVNIFLRTLNNIPDEQVQAFTKKTMGQVANVKNSFVEFLAKHGSPITDAVTNVRDQVKNTINPPQKPEPDTSENRPPFSFRQYLAANANKHDNPQDLQAAAQEAGRQAEEAGHPVIA